MGPKPRSTRPEPPPERLVRGEQRTKPATTGRAPRGGGVDRQHQARVGSAHRGRGGSCPGSCGQAPGPAGCHARAGEERPAGPARGPSSPSHVPDARMRGLAPQHLRPVTGREGTRPCRCLPPHGGLGHSPPHPRRKGLLPLPGPYQHKHLSDKSGGPWGRGPRHATARTSRPSPHGAGRAWTAHQLAGSAGHCWGRLGCVWVSSPGRRSSQSPSTAGPPATWGPRRGDSSRTLNFTRTQHPGAVHPRPQRSVRPVTLGMKGEHTALGG